MIILSLLFLIIWVTVLGRFFLWSLKYVTAPIDDYFKAIDAKTTEPKIDKKQIVEIKITYLKGPNEDDIEENNHKPYNRIKRFES